MEDKDLFEQLARGPLNRNGFDESLKRRINDSLERPGRARGPSRPWLLRWPALSFSLLLVLGIGAGVWSLSAGTGQRDNLSKTTEQPVSSSAASGVGPVDPTPHSAVVIGLRQDGDSPDSASTYRTIIVAPENDKLTYVRSGDGIWMPYKSNFWKIEYRNASAANAGQSLIALKSGESSAEKPAADATATDGAVAGRTEKLLYAGNRFVSILQTDGDGRTRALVNQVTELDPKVRAADPETLVNTRYTFAAALGDAAAGQDADEWAIAREDAKWVAKKPSGDGGSATSDWTTIDADLTADVVKDLPLAISWEDVLKLDRSAIDAYTSQDGDMAVVVSAERIQVIPYLLPQADRQPVEFELRPNESVVMVQWATQAKYVDNWKQMFGKWFAASAS
ncbi:hypothetical protein ACFPPD_03255 [Cohnella suwonensis]|uniref:DUF4340 domain-containing protein n=1 Tax=Cohnella suwonensis TaxID=696072 RepID=A0ABW0LSQ7_9BACL